VNWVTTTCVTEILLKLSEPKSNQDIESNLNVLRELFNEYNELIIALCTILSVDIPTHYCSAFIYLFHLLLQYWNLYSVNAVKCLIIKSFVVRCIVTAVLFKLHGMFFVKIIMLNRAISVWFTNEVTTVIHWSRKCV